MLTGILAKIHTNTRTHTQFDYITKHEFGLVNKHLHFFGAEKKTAKDITLRLTHYYIKMRQS